MTFISYLMQSMFIIELYFSFTFFLFVFPRRKYWYFPFALLAIANVAIQISLRFASSSALNPVYVLLIQLANLVLFFMMALLTLDVKPGTALMVLLTCYITHRLEYLTFILICLATSQDLGTNYNLCFAQFGIAIDVVITLANYFLVQRRLRDQSLGRSTITVLVLASVLVFSGAFMDVYFFNAARNLIIMQRIQDLFLCLAALIMIEWIYTNLSLNDEVNLLKSEEKKNKESSLNQAKDMEIFETHFHDMKKLLNSYSEESRALLLSPYLEDMKKTMGELDQAVDTGNSSLDIILSERIVACKKDKITLIYQAQGKALSFVDAVDLYAILANTIDNARESVLKIEDVSKRIITLQIRSEKNMVLIHSDNFIGQSPRWKNGRLLTSKEDKNNHGYGLRSIENTLHKYGGEMTIDIRNDVFNIDMLLPIPADNLS
jgi:hypothetical protein